MKMVQQDKEALQSTTYSLLVSTSKYTWYKLVNTSHGTIVLCFPLCLHLQRLSLDCFIHLLFTYIFCRKIYQSLKKKRRKSSRIYIS
jgi:hypothetical protein